MIVETKNCIISYSLNYYLNNTSIDIEYTVYITSIYRINKIALQCKIRIGTNNTRSMYKLLFVVLHVPEGFNNIKRL